MRPRRKKKLIEAIHGLQPARLTTAFFKQEGTNVMQQLELLDLYLDAMPGGSDPDDLIAARVRARDGSCPFRTPLETDTEIVGTGREEDN